jgi:hypothetical protein
MQLELSCTSCGCTFTPGPRSAVAKIVREAEETGPWWALGDGETLEDVLFHRLSRAPATSCPACGGPATVDEGALGEWSYALLATW